MDTALTANQVVNTDEQEKKHLEAIAKEVGYALDKKTGLLEVQPGIDQHPLSEKTQKEIEEYDVESEKDSKLGFFIPVLRKSIRTTKAMNFLGKKMEWLRKKNVGEVAFK